jgi:hypothetical protein
MKERLLTMFFTIASIGIAIACDNPLTPKIVGPTTVCPNNGSEDYRLEVQCTNGVYDANVSNNGTLVYGAGTSFDVFWSNNTTQQVSSTITANYYDCVSNYFTVTEQITIQPGILANPGTPSVVSITDQGGGLFRFSTSSANASTYIWTVSGGTVEGSSTGSSINVRATDGACTISGTVKGRRTGACNLSSISSGRSFSRTIPVPARPGTISFTPFDGSRTIYRIDPVADAFYYEWTISGTGVQLQTASKLVTATVYCSSPTGSGVLKVRAITSCGASNWRSIEVGCGLGCPSLAYPNPALIGYPIRICDSASQIKLLNGIGEEMSINVSNTEDGELSINTDQLLPGIYFMHITNENGLISVKRIVLNK